MGYSFCRFACGIPDDQMGSTEFYDGIWLWPEGLAHCVERHSVCLPDEFIETMRSRCWQVPADIKLVAGAERMVLRKVGYWRSDREPNLPDPRLLVQPGCYGDNLARILEYLRSGRDYIFDVLENDEYDEEGHEDLSFWRTWAAHKKARRSDK